MRLRFYESAYAMDDMRLIDSIQILWEREQLDNPGVKYGGGFESWACLNHHAIEPLHALELEARDGEPYCQVPTLSGRFMTYWRYDADGTFRSEPERPTENVS